MHAAHLGGTETSSAASLLRLNVGTNASAARESLGFAWLRETGPFAEIVSGKAGAAGVVCPSKPFEPVPESVESAVNGKVIRPVEHAVGNATRVNVIAAENATKAGASDKLGLLSQPPREGNRRKASPSYEPRESAKPQLETAQRAPAATEVGIRPGVREMGAAIATGPASAPSTTQEDAKPSTDGGRKSSPGVRPTNPSLVPVSLPGADASAKTPMRKGPGAESIKAETHVKKTEAVSPGAVAVDWHANAGSAATVPSVPPMSHAVSMSAAIQIPAFGHPVSPAAGSPGRQVAANAASEAVRRGSPDGFVGAAQVGCCSVRRHAWVVAHPHRTGLSRTGDGIADGSEQRGP